MVCGIQTTRQYPKKTYHDLYWHLSTLPLQFGGLGIYFVVDIIEFVFVAFGYKPLGFKPMSRGALVVLFP